MNTENEKLNLWCIVELFGHSQIAGKCTEQNIAGTNMLRVDVPETSKNGPFTKFYGAAAIYAINPVTEEVVKAKAEMLQTQPIERWNIKTFNDKILQLNSGNVNDVDFEDDLLP
ncbi:hypothetical protein [Pedobacter zeae]|uniref:Uncharacterized protein n=1 Tax=Pedobacter zeae TaxID=1737356 RepID=A0A7W6P4L1_9SPHI|nr:hypothetical protein [Pedobacter zeae]MBB4107704.1 hypothetical protein [Pedobacter zeae]GGG97612.1 hypothetical protein GCM10007422_09480 [Pedobacter zeae]